LWYDAGFELRLRAFLFLVGAGWLSSSAGASLYLLEGPWGRVSGVVGYSHSHLNRIHSRSYYMSCEIARYLIYASVSCMNGAFVALRLNSESVMNSPFYESPFSPQILYMNHQDWSLLRGVYKPWHIAWLVGMVGEAWLQSSESPGAAGEPGR